MIANGHIFVATVGTWQRFIAVSAHSKLETYVLSRRRSILNYLFYCSGYFTELGVC